MKRKFILSLLPTLFLSTVQADEVLEGLDQVNTSASEFRMNVVKCYVQMKLLKSEGWNAEQCILFIASKNSELPKIKYDLGTLSARFKENQKLGKYDSSQTAKGMELMVSIQTHFEGFRKINKEIKSFE